MVKKGSRSSKSSRGLRGSKDYRPPFPWGRTVDGVFKQVESAGV